MAGINYTDLDNRLTIELGDLSGNIWDTDTRRLKMNEAIGWFSRIFPDEQERSYTVTLNQTSQQVSITLPDETSQPPWRVSGVLLVDKRVAQQPDTADDDLNSLISDTIINSTLTWRLKAPDTVVFSQGLGSGSGINGAQVVGASLTVIAWFAWYDFDQSDTLTIDAAFGQLLLLKSAELCHVWAQPLAARLGRDMGSDKAAASYAARVAEIVAALNPALAKSRALKK
jgi:hypothetical protein